MPFYDVIIDSSKRNTAIYPSNNSWKYNCIKNTYQNIKKVELVQAIIPNTQYIINSNNNVITITGNGQPYAGTIVNGNYTPSTLATAIATALNNNGSTLTYTCSVDTNISYLFTITSSNTVTLNFSKNTILGNILGFGVTDTTAGTTFTGTNVCSVNTTRFWKLSIEELGTNYETNIPSLFTFIIPNNSTFGTITYYKLSDGNFTMSYETTGAKDYITTLTFNLQDEWSYPANLEGKEYIIYLRIYTF